MSKFFLSRCKAVLLAAVAALQVLAGVSVPLVVVNRTPFKRSGEMVASGFPLPREAGITEAGCLAIRDASGVRVPSQFEVTGRWGGPVHDVSKPIKWVLATFPATVEANASAHYVLDQGGLDPTPGRLGVEDLPSLLIIDTGAARYVLNKQRFTLLESVTIGGVAITRPEGSGLSLLDSQGVRYLSTVTPPKTFVLESQGPLRAVVKVAGTLTSIDGRPGLDYTLWLTFSGGRTEVRGALTLGNHREAVINEAFNCCKPDVFNFFGSNSFSFREMSACLQLANGGGGFDYRMPGRDGILRGSVVEAVKAYQDSSGTDFWNRYDAGDHPRPNSYNRFRGYRVSDGGRSLGEGDQHAGWLLLEKAGTGISGGILEFWQNYPKALVGSAAGAMELQFFPKDHAGTFNFRVGEEKTHEFFFDFHSGSSADPEGLAAALCSPLFAAAPGSWYVDSRALEDTALSPHGSVESRMEPVPAERPGSALVATAKYDYFNDRTLLLDPNYTQGYYYNFRSFWQSTSAPSALDYFDFYGWYWWGDTMLDFEMAGDGKAGSHTGKYDFDHGAWLQYFRSGDPRWREIALALSRHRERQMLHDVGFVHHDADGWSIWQDAMWGHSQHDVSGNADGNRNPISGSPEVAFGARGSWLNYHLTGYPPSRRFAEKAARYHYKYWSLDNRYQATSELGLDVRALANSVNALTAGYRATAEPRYADLVVAIMTARAPEKQSFIQGPRQGASGSIGVFMLTQYICALARFSGAAEEMGATAAAQLARSQVVRFTDWMITCGSNTSQPIATSLNQQGWFGIYGTFRNDGSNRRSDVLTNNWQLTAADCAAYAYAFSGDRRYMAVADRYFENAVSNPFYEDSVLIYSDTKEAVNHATFGHAYLYWKDKLGAATGDTAAPGLNWVQPLEGAEVTGTVVLKVRATDDAGVQRVDYSLDGTALGSATLAPFDFAFPSGTATNGRHALAAVAFDFAGNASPAQVLGIVVRNQVDTTAPRVALLNPAGPSEWAGTASLRAEAVDDSAVAGLQFLLDGQPIGPVLVAAPYTFDLDTRTLADGSYLVSARATDPSGNVGTSAAVAVSIGNHNRPPTAVLDLETDRVYQIGDRVGFSAARSSDPEGSALSCSWAFGDGGTAVGSSTGHAYAAAGSYLVSLEVSDGSRASAATRSITVHPAGAVREITLHPAADTLVRSSFEGNYGRGSELAVYNGADPDYRSLLQFDLRSVPLPAGATIVSAKLQLQTLTTQGAPVEAFRVTRNWTEGTGSYGNTRDGATWAQAGPDMPWMTAGCDVDAASDHGLGANGVLARVLPRVGTTTLELGSVVAQWLAGTAPNCGVLLAIPASDRYTVTTFGSRESASPPVLVISYLGGGSPDTASPTVRLLDPKEGDTLTGTVTLTAEASDDQAVAEVRFHLDGQEIGRVSEAAAFTCAVDTRTLSNGQHQVSATAIDRAGNTGSSPLVSVLIDNPGGPPPQVLEVTLEAASDALFRASHEGNYGAHDRLWVYNGLGSDYRSVLHFDLAPYKFPAGATLLSAQLRLHTHSTQGAPVLAYRVTRPWTEGTGTYGNTCDGVTWERARADADWGLPGGDFDAQSDYGEGANGVVAKVIPQMGIALFELKSLVAQWLAGTVPNCGVLLAHPASSSYTGSAFGSRESGTPPTLVITVSVPR